MSNNIVFVLIICFISKIDLQSVNQTSCSYGTVLINNVCNECGTTDFTPNIRIVGGQAAIPNSWPAQALVIMSYTTNTIYGRVSAKFLCGGTLINSRTILLAAHCIVKQFTSNGYTVQVAPNSYYPTWGSMFTVYLGAHDISFVSTQTNPSYPTVQMSVSDVIIHPSYNSYYNNDIALLILSAPVTTNSAIKYACLPRQSTSIPTANQSCYASGWGALREGGSSPSILYNVKMTIYDSSACSNDWNSYPKDWNSQICAGDLTGQKDTCQGDSGGGLYILDSTINKYIVIGITSYGEGCARVGKPGIYTRVSNYIDWIKSNSEIVGTQTTTRTTTTTTTSAPTTTTTRTSTTSITTTTRTSTTGIIISSITTQSLISAKNQTNNKYDIANNVLQSVNNFIGLIDSILKFLNSSNGN